MIITIPHSLYRDDEAIDVAEELLELIGQQQPCTSEEYSWTVAGVRAIERYNIDFTPKEAEFFDECLSFIAQLISD